MQRKFVKNTAGLILILGLNAHAFDLFGMQQMLQEKIEAARATNGLVPSGSYQIQAQPQSLPTQNFPVITQEELIAKINSLGKSNGFTVFSQKKEGFAINQKNYMDPEGKVVKYGFDGVSGMVSYLAEITPGQYVIKTMQAQSSGEAVVIANARQIGGIWEVMTVTGKRLTGEAIVMGSRGFTLNRENGAIIFDPLSGIKTAAIPDGYAIADFQNGDATQTKFVLLETIKPEDDNSKLMGTFKSLGSSLGLTKKEDYGLMNLDTGKMSMFNISSESKNRSECIQKQRINSLVNKCEKSISFETLYDQFGMPNVGHYYWRVTWMKTPSQKIIAITIEDGVKRLIATDLTTGKRVLLKERMMGINQFKVRQDESGKIAVDVQLGFANETVEDVENQLNILPDIQAS